MINQMAFTCTRIRDWNVFIIMHLHAQYHLCMCMYMYNVHCVCVSYSSKEYTVHDSWPHRFDVDIDTVGEHNLLDLVGVWINTPGHGKVERHNNRQQLLSTKINHTN